MDDLGTLGGGGGGGNGALDSTSPSYSAAARWVPFLAAFIAKSSADPRAIWTSFTMIIFSEIGDKTFLIAAILSMRQSRLTVFFGAFSALAAMSILSSFLGVMFPTLLPKSLTTLLASLLFFIFGTRMLKEGWAMSGNEMGEEWEEAKKEIEEEEESHEMRNKDELEALEEAEGPRRGSYPNVEPYPRMIAPSTSTTTATTASAAADTNGHASPPHSRSDLSTYTTFLKEGTRNICGLCVSPVFAQSFILTFLGEWGDRSQIATIALAAAHSIWLVSFGTILGHCLCTGLAVMGGSWLATRISVRHVTLGGSLLFLLFGFLYLGEAWWEFGKGSEEASSSATIPTALTGSSGSGGQPPTIPQGADVVAALAAAPIVERRQSQAQAGYTERDGRRTTEEEEEEEEEDLEERKRREVLQYIERIATSAVADPVAFAA